MWEAIPRVILIGIAAGLATTSIYCPQYLSDENKFLKDFVNQNALQTLGFIVTITLASAASLHLELNKLEDNTGLAFVRTRSSVRKSAYALLVLLAATVVLVVAKPLLPVRPTIIGQLCL